MRRIAGIILTLGLMFSIYGYCLAQQDMEAASRIAAVTIYPDSALISRVASFKLDSGEYRITFPNIIPEVDENSLRVSGQGSATFKLFEAEVKKEFLKEVPSERIKQLKEEIEKISDGINRLQGTKALLLEEKNFLKICHIKMILEDSLTYLIIIGRIQI